MAGATERIALGTTVLVLPHRHPVLAAKMLATLDHLSGGRLIVGAGVGWMREEIELLGAPFDRRGAWSDEAIRIMRACWRDGRASHRGEFFAFDEIGVMPTPVRRDRARFLAGYDYSGVPTTGDKETRAMPLRAQVEAREVALVRGPWNEAFLQEAEVFPNGTYKDQVDPAAHAFNDLATGPRPAKVRSVRWG